jgi:pimeloyl-ACP methyl ester carboxylesterase
MPTSWPAFALQTGGEIMAAIPRRASSRVTPFHIDVPDAVLADLAVRLDRTRLAAEVDDGAWTRGTHRGYLASLVRYWRDEFDWRAQEAVLNRLPHGRVEIDGLGIHIVHVRGRGPNPLPLILTHGYPDSFIRFLDLLPRLTDPAAHGGDAADAFDVVVPSLPGYGFSDPPKKAGTTFRIGELWHTLMTDVLGYRRYGAHGGDWGSTVTEQLARSHAGAVVGVHLTDVPFWHQFQKPSDPSAAEQAFFAETEAWLKEEGAYALIQGTRPSSLAPALNDSPAGLAAWIVEKFQRWSDCGGDVERRFSKDLLLTNVTTYWVTGTIGSAFLPYYDFSSAGVLRWMVEAVKQWTGSSDVPAGFALFPKDLSRPPRAWAERFFNVQRWTEMPRGGHFAALEEPDLLATDLRAFFRPLRPAAGIS